MGARARVALVALVAASGVLAGCGAGARPIAATPSSPSAEPTPQCPRLTRCWSFSDGTSGWPDVSDNRHYATRDTYRGGSYHVGVRDGGAFVVTAPVAVAELAQDRGVRVTLTATTPETFPKAAAWGAACWTRPGRDGPVGGFAVHVTSERVALGVDNPTTGTFQPLRTVELPGVVRLGKANKLELSCREQKDAGEIPFAVVEVRLNDAEPIVLRYPPRTGSRSWRPADGVGVLASGDDADVFFDDITVARACEKECGPGG